MLHFEWLPHFFPTVFFYPYRLRVCGSMMGKRWYVVYLNFIGNKQPVSFLPPCTRECTPSTFVSVLAHKQFLYDTNVHTHKTESKVRLKDVGEIRRKPSYASIRGGLISKVVFKELKLGLTFTSSVSQLCFEDFNTPPASDAKLCLLQVWVSWRDTLYPSMVGGLRQVLVISHGKYICQGHLLTLTFTYHISSSSSFSTRDETACPHKAHWLLLKCPIFMLVDL